MSEAFEIISSRPVTHLLQQGHPSQSLPNRHQVSKCPRLWGTPISNHHTEITEEKAQCLRKILFFFSSRVCLGQQLFASRTTNCILNSAFSDTWKLPLKNVGGLPSAPWFPQARRKRRNTLPDEHSVSVWWTAASAVDTWQK